MLITYTKITEFQIDFPMLHREDFERGDCKVISLFVFS